MIPGLAGRGGKLRQQHRKSLGSRLAGRPVDRVGLQVGRVVPLDLMIDLEEIGCGGARREPQDQDGADRLRHPVDSAVIDELANELYGKRPLITDRSERSDEQIRLAYRGQSEVEETFRQLKGDERMAVRPQYHRTDQKICAHTFRRLLALLLGRLVEFQARQMHYTEGLSGLLDLLAAVCLAMLLKPAGKRGARSRCE